MIDPRRLQLLAHLERLGTIAAVAEELHLTPSGVSMQLTALERESGVTVTERAGRRLRLTPAGTLLARHGRELATTLTMAELELEGIRSGTSGRYRIAAFPTATQALVAPLARSMGNLPDLELDIDVLEPDDAVAALLAGSADLALVHGYSNLPTRQAPRLHAVTLGSEPVLLATSDAGTGALVDVADHPFITAPEGLACERMVTTACRSSGFEPRVTVRTVDYAVQLALVGAGVGVALVPRMATAAIPTGVQTAPADPRIRRTVSVVIRGGREDDAGLRAVIERLLALAPAVLDSDVNVDADSAASAVKTL